MEEKKELTPKQKWFEDQPEDKKWTIVKSFLDTRHSAVTAKMSVFPTLSTISVAMLIILTFRKDLIPLNPVEIKILLSFFLFLIPVSLLIFIFDTEKGAYKSDEYHHEFNVKHPVGGNKRYWDKLRNQITWWKHWDNFVSEFPGYIAIIYLGIIVFLIWKIFSNSPL